VPTANSYETVSEFVKVMPRNRGLFFPDKVYVRSIR